MRTKASPTTTSDGGVLDLRTYELVSSGGNEFDTLFREHALPLLRQHGITVAGYGPSLDDNDHYYLARIFSSAAERKQQLERFYGGDAWRQNYRDTTLALIETYHTVAVPLAPIARTLQATLR
jgi:hypothetical protein